MRWPARSLPKKWDLASSGDGGSSSGSRGNRLARVGTDALDHGAQPVGTLRRQMFAESEFVEHRDRIAAQDLLRRMTGIQRQQNRDQSAHDMRVAVAKIIQPGFRA